MKTRGRLTRELARRAQARFHGCDACSEAFTSLEEVLERCRLSKVEIQCLDGKISCPGCGKYLTLLDDVADYSAEELKENRRLDAGLEKYIPKFKLLNDFMQRFPTLGLLHPVGEKIFRAVKKANVEVLEPKTWYRGDGRKHVSSVGDFLGSDPMRPYRFNHAGQRAFYLATEEETAVVETLQERKDRTLRIWLAEISVQKRLRVLNLATRTNQSLFLEILIRSSLMQTPRRAPGYFQPQYLLTRFLADVVRWKGLDGILYTSSQEYPFTYEIRGTNLVILRPDYRDFVKPGRYERRAWKHTGDWLALDPERMVLDTWEAGA